MTSAALQQRARPVIAVAATLFLVALFLGWQRVAVSMPALDVRSTASGSGGWGALAGLCALGLLTLAIVAGSPPATASTGIGAFVFRSSTEAWRGHAQRRRGRSMMRRAMADSRHCGSHGSVFDARSGSLMSSGCTRTSQR